MLRKNKLDIPETKLVFSTVISETTKDVKLVILPGNIWHIYRGHRGILLVDRKKEKGKRDTYLLSEIKHNIIPQDTAFKIDPRNGVFNIQYTRGKIEYSFRDSEYMPLPYAKHFMERGKHKFRCGSLEFTLELQDKGPVQLSLFSN